MRLIAVMDVNVPDLPRLPNRRNPALYQRSRTVRFFDAQMVAVHLSLMEVQEETVTRALEERREQLEKMHRPPLTPLRRLLTRAVSKLPLMKFFSKQRAVLMSPTSPDQGVSLFCLAMA